jgi:hypothetical protein
LTAPAGIHHSSCRWIEKLPSICDATAARRPLTNETI